MRQTIYGETHKSKIYDKKSISLFLENEKSKYLKFKNRLCLYDKNNIAISSPSINYLNDNSENKDPVYFIKNIISSEFDYCEKIYPYLGDIFLECLFENKKLSSKYNTFKFHNNLKNDFIKSIDDETVRNIANIYFDNFSLENTISVEKYFEKDIKIIKTTDLIFDIEYDNDFYKNNQKTIVTNYKVILLDGYIQTIGEIHHLLTASNEKKENYVLFCYGMSEEVKQTILHNNRLRKTYVYPVVFSLNEKNLNVLNDISIIHDSADVISSNTGSTISQQFRNNNIKTGKKIIFKNNSFIVEPNCSKKELSNHRKYLKKRIDDLKSYHNKDIISERIKRFSSNNITILIPDTVWNYDNFVRNLDYLLRFFSNCKKYFIKYQSPDKKKFYYFPVDSIYLINNVNQSFKEKINNLDLIIGLSEKGEKNEN